MANSLGQLTFLKEMPVANKINTPDRYAPGDFFVS